MKLKFHVYSCEPCIATFAAEAHEDLDHSDIVCPFCGSDEGTADVGYGEMEVDHEKRQEVNQETEDSN